MYSTQEANLERPDRFDQLSHDLLQITEGGGGVSLFGLPFLAAGVFLLLAAADIIPFENADEIQGWMYPVLLVMAIAFGSVGAILVFGRKWYTLDRGKGTIVVSKGLWVPMKREEMNLRLYDTVGLDHSAGDSDSPDRYPVFLKGTGAAKPLELVDGREYGSSRRKAVYLAEFLGLPLEDVTSDHALKLSPEAVHSTYRERARDNYGTTDGVSRPLHMKSQIERGNGQLTISIPRPSRLATAALSAAIPLVAVLYFGTSAIEFFDRSDTPEEIKLFFVGIASLFVLVPIIGVIRVLINSKRPGTVVTLNRDTLAIDVRSGGRKKTTVIPLSEIIDIDFSSREAIYSAMNEVARQTRNRYASDYPRPSRGQLSPGVVKALWLLRKFIPSKGITVKSDRGLHSFGTGLPDDEIRYLHSQLREYLQRW